jgi:hypothetical protein
MQAVIHDITALLAMGLRQPTSNKGKQFKSALGRHGVPGCSGRLRWKLDGDASNGSRSQRGRPLRPAK